MYSQTKLEVRYVELRAGEGELTGTVVRYGEWNRIGSYPHRERVDAGAFELSDVIVNLQHNRSQPVARQGTEFLQFDDDGARLEMRLKYPPTTYGKMARELVEAGVLRGLSVEMQVGSDEWQGRDRTIRSARVHGVGIVDRPAYKEAVIHRSQLPLDQVEFDMRPEYRQRSVASGRMPWGQVSIVSAATGRAVDFRAGSLELADDVVLLHGLNYDNILASTGSGTLDVFVSKDGVRWTAKKLPRTQVGRDVRTLINGRLITGWRAGYIPIEASSRDVVLNGMKFTVEEVEKGILCEIGLISGGTGGVGPVRKRSALV